MTDPYVVRCPACLAEPGERCTNRIRPLESVHWSRHRLARQRRSRQPVTARPMPPRPRWRAAPSPPSEVAGDAAADPRADHRPRRLATWSDRRASRSSQAAPVWSIQLEAARSESGCAS